MGLICTAPLWECLFIWMKLMTQLPVWILYIWGPFHKSSYERFLLYEFVKPVLNYRFNEFVALTNLCETGPCSFWIITSCPYFIIWEVLFAIARWFLASRGT